MNAECNALCLHLSSAGSSGDRFRDSYRREREGNRGRKGERGKKGKIS